MTFVCMYDTLHPVPVCGVFEFVRGPLVGTPRVWGGTVKTPGILPGKILPANHVTGNYRYQVSHIPGTFCSPLNIWHGSLVPTMYWALGEPYGIIITLCTGIMFAPWFLRDGKWHLARWLCFITIQTQSLPVFFYKKLKNVSFEYDRLNGWNSTLQAAWYIRHVRWTCLFYVPFIIWCSWIKPTIWLLVLSFTIFTEGRLKKHILR